jgi:hypothetical protein
MVWDEPVRAADGLTEPSYGKQHAKRSQAIWAPHRAVGEVVSQPADRSATHLGAVRRTGALSWIPVGSPCTPGGQAWRRGSR